MKRGRKPKFTRDQIEHMRELYFRKHPPMSYAAIARMFGTSQSTVMNAVNGKLNERMDRQ